MRQVTVSLVFSLKFTHVKVKGPNKTIQTQEKKLEDVLKQLYLLRGPKTAVNVACEDIFILLFFHR